MVVMVQVFVSGEVSSPTVTYSMLTSVPPANGAPVVDIGGDVNLVNMAPGVNFTPATDIYFVLTGGLTDSNGGTTAYPVFFQSPANKAVTITGQNGGPAPGFNASLPGDVSVLLINDLDNNSNSQSNTYNYTLNVEAYIDGSASPTTIQLDPAIINRFPTTC
jgi:hypothetical protein